MATSLQPSLIGVEEERREATARFLVEKRIHQGEFLEKLKDIDQEIKKKKRQMKSI